MLPAWEEMIKASGVCKNSDGFQYDLVDLTRQVLANYALPLQRKFVAAYEIKDQPSFNRYANEFLGLIKDADKLLATRKDFMLGPWIATARKWGATESEKALYESNAKDLITLWGDAANPLHEYACRQWSGLLADFYLPRWQKFFEAINASLAEAKEFDNAAFQKSIAQWEWRWVKRRKDYPVRTAGNPVDVATSLYKKYRSRIENVE